MGMDITMNEPPTAAEVRQAKLDHDDPAYYRFNHGSMAAMVLTMISAGAVVQGDPAPTFPTWPPAGTPADRKDLLDEALADASLEVKLTPPEQIRVRTVRKRWKQLLATHSARKGKVPAFKFMSNEDWIVAGDECTVIATKLRAYAAHLTQRDLDAFDKAYTESQRALTAKIQQPGMTTVLGNEGLGISLDEFRAWIEQWATFNEIAARHGGYHVD